jgi:hypothetical protein
MSFHGDVLVEPSTPFRGASVLNKGEPQALQRWWWQERSRPLIVREFLEVSKMLAIAPKMQRAL